MSSTTITFDGATGVTHSVLVWTADRSQLLTSGGLTAIGSVADAAIASGKLTATELTTSNSTGLGSFSATYTWSSLADAQYVVDVYATGSPTVSTPKLYAGFSFWKIGSLLYDTILEAVLRRKRWRNCL